MGFTTFAKLLRAYCAARPVAAKWGRARARSPIVPVAFSPHRPLVSRTPSETEAEPAASACGDVNGYCRHVRRTRTVIGLLAVGVIVALSMRRAAVPTTVSSPDASLLADETYATIIQPILDHRCVVCHSCLDSPCQLNLQSFEGLDRGGNATPVYQPDRWMAIHPTRMFQDAQTTAQWRERYGFFPVVLRGVAASANPERSLLWDVIDQRRRKPLPLSVDIDEQTVCPANVEALDRRLRSDPAKGMPYGFPR
jgi:Fatty acid cis/trans isomerase (CTI)